MPTPAIFLSAASADLEEWRNLLHKAFERAGCKVHTQKQSFAASSGNVLDLLRQHLDKSDYVIHLAGLSYGAEPEKPAFDGHPDFKCSYTQFEYYYAHQQGKKVIAFVCAADFPYLKFTETGTDDADRERRRQLQVDHRERVTKGRFTGTPLEGHPHRPLSEAIADVGALIAAVAGAIGTIRDHAPALAAVQQELIALASVHQLPPVPSGFVGRTADLAILRGRRSAGGAHLTGLKGMGGIGKTALAIVLAHEWSNDFPDAQLFLDGRGTHADAPSGADLVAQAIHAFHPTARLPEGEKELRDIYLNILTGQRVLVLLDNARDAAQAKPLLPPDGCALLVTSRHSFMLGNVAPHRVGELPEPEAVELLRELCPTLADADAVAVGRRCARLPLALRLAGAHLALDASDRGAPDTAGYLAQLNSGRLHALDADADDAGEITISETLRLSESALPEDLRDTWRKLGVFPASFDTTAALAIAGATADMLTHLLRRSLIEAEGPRHRLHDLAAEYACGQLSADAVTALRLVHAGHYRKVLADCDDAYLAGGSGLLTGLGLFDTERAQIQAAHAWLLAAPQADSLRNEFDALLIRYPDAGAYIFSLRQHPRERIAWLEAALAAALRLNNRGAEGNALGNLGLAWADLGDARKAIGFYDQHLVIAREIGDRGGEGNALGNLGNAWAALGDARKAIGYYEQNLVIDREIGDRRGEGNALGNLGSAWRNLGDARKAIGYHEQALVVSREVGDRRGEGADLGNLGLAWAALGDARKAIGYHEQNLVIAREIGDRRAEGSALGSLGNAWADLDDARKAIGYYEERLVIAREIGDRRGEANALFNSAIELEKLNELAEAGRRAEQAAEIYAAIESPVADRARKFADRLRGGG